jgi:hypothetical protein
VLRRLPIGVFWTTAFFPWPGSPDACRDFSPFRVTRCDLAVDGWFLLLDASLIAIFLDVPPVFEYFAQPACLQCSLARLAAARFQNLTLCGSHESDGRRTEKSWEKSFAKERMPQPIDAAVTDFLRDSADLNHQRRKRGDRDRS